MRTCDIEGCDRKHLAKGLCSRHYRLANTSPCTFDGCGKRVLARGLCTGHYKQEVAGLPLTPLRFKPDRPEGKPLEYATIHARLARLIGRASDMACVRCGEPADEWAYMGGAAEPLYWTPPNHPKLVEYSTVLEDYSPMCRSCHRTMDATPSGRAHRTAPC